MSLVQMSVSGAVMILFTVVIRAMLLHKLPKRTFPILWWFVLARLLVPLSLPCVFSVYSLLSRKVVPEETPKNIIVSPLPVFLTESSANMPGVQSNAPPAVSSVDTLTAVWLTGISLCFVFFAASYVKCRIGFGESLPVDNEYITQWLAEHKTFRRISVRCSDRISAPMTYGIFRPVILLPKNFDQLGGGELKFVLTHEYVHIRRLDAVFKLALIAAVCVHWFNPMVWAMLIVANKDIEISCDEAVIRIFGDCEKQTYATTLVRMEERRSGLVPLNNSFSGNAIKERIVAIMKFKKATVLTVIASICLVAGTTTVFATSAQPQEDNAFPSETTSTVGETNVNTVGEPKTDDVDSSKAEPVISSAANTVSEPKTPADETSGETDNSRSADDKTELPVENEMLVAGLEAPPNGSWFRTACDDGIIRYFPFPDEYWNRVVEIYIDENDNVIARFAHIEDVDANAAGHIHEEDFAGGTIRW